MDDPRIKVEEGIDGDFVLIGFPHHIGAKRDGLRLGQDDGPDCLRRFLPKIGPLINAEYQRDISQKHISDYGNIHIDDDNNLELLLEKLTNKYNLVRTKNHIPIIIGGTKEVCTAAFQNDIHVISIIPEPDIHQPYDGDKISANCSVRQRGFKNISYFAIQEQKLTQNDRNYLQNIRCISLKDIRMQTVNISKNMDEPITQAGVAFKLLLESQTSKFIHLSFSLEAIDGAYCPGVSRPAIFGLTSQESAEIMFIAGQSPKVVSLDITDFNPTIEDYRTGFLLGNLIYYYILGKGVKYN